MRRVALLVTHLMGTGHLVRILAIARAVKAAGGLPTIISGGRPLDYLDVAGIEMVQLPPVMARIGDYRTLRDTDGAPIDGTYLADRRAMLVRALTTARPDVLVCELWPFGRRVLADEFLTAMDALPSVPVVCSLRDVLEPPSRRKRVDEALQHTAGLAAVLVHGDPAILPLEQSWPAATELGEKLHYTGYVTGPLPRSISEPETVLVSVGGGATGRELLRMAAEAAKGSPLRWRLMVGGADAANFAASLPGPAVAEPARADYRARLGGVAVSVSLAGYNTAAEVVAAGVPALFVPMEEGGEQEQRIRAAAFAAAFTGVQAVSVADLTPALLAARAERLAGKAMGIRQLRTDGAAVAAKLLLDLV